MELIILSERSQFQQFSYDYFRADPLDDANNVLKWLISNVEGDQIEEVTDEMLDKLVAGDQPGITSVFCKYALRRNASIHKYYEYFYDEK